MTTLPLAPAYRDPIWAAVVLQMGATLVLITILDNGTIAHVGGCVMAGFWIGVALVMFRRPRDPSLLDLFYIRWGYFALLVVGMALSPLMGALPG